MKPNTDGAEDLHVVPCFDGERKHDTSCECWCGLVRDTEDPRIWVHKQVQWQVESVKSVVARESRPSQRPHMEWGEVVLAGMAANRGGMRRLYIDHVDVAVAYANGSWTVQLPNGQLLSAGACAGRDMKSAMSAVEDNLPRDAWGLPPA